MNTTLMGLAWHVKELRWAALLVCGRGVDVLELPNPMMGVLSALGPRFRSP